MLTFFTVFALPPWHAGQLSVAGARVVAEAVVPGHALLGAALPVVVLLADEAVGVSQLRLPPGLGVLGVLGPLAAHPQLSLDGEEADQHVRVVGVCGGEHMEEMGVDLS